MAEWTQADAEKLAKAQHNLMGQNPAGPDLGYQDYINHSDVLRNQLIATNAHRRQIKTMMEENASLRRLAESAQDVAQEAALVAGENETLKEEIKTLRSELAKLKKKK